jgi:hypothetical protein
LARALHWRRSIVAFSPLAFPKRCGCCGAEYVKGAWSRLRLVGYMHDEGNVVLELRECRCHSALALCLERTAMAAS